MNGAVNVNDPKDLGVIVLVLIQAIKFIGLGWSRRAWQRGSRCPTAACCPNQGISESLPWQNKDLLHLSSGCQSFGWDDGFKIIAGPPNHSSPLNMMPFRCQVAADFGLAAQTTLVLAHGYLCYAGRALEAWHAIRTSITLCCPVSQLACWLRARYRPALLACIFSCNAEQHQLTLP